MSRNFEIIKNETLHTFRNNNFSKEDVRQYCTKCCIPFRKTLDFLNENDIHYKRIRRVVSEVTRLKLSSTLKQKIICDKCKRSISKSNFNKHICLSESDVNVQYVRNLYNDGQSTFTIVNKGFNKQFVKFALKGRKRSVSEASKLAHKNHPESYKLSDETKEKIRQRQVAYFKLRNTKNAFQRRSNGELSYGEQWLHDLFVKHHVYEKYDVVNEYCEYPYFLDFAFVNEKVDVEFDGKWHFTETRQERDRKRDGYLQQKGWRIYRIAYHQIKDFEINTLFEFIGNANRKHHTYDLIKYCEIKKTKQLERKLKKQQQRQIKRVVFDAQKNKKIQQRLQLLSTIDMNRYGWMNEASKLLGISHTSIRRYIERHKINCFRRKTEGGIA
ncbi:MAG: DUF559 domain-containing protein [Nitrosarchaeum sp.]|nr:DUF559 domain-containing protein [Nitrosarchaeum sp.]